MPLGSLTGFDYGQIARRPGGELTQWGSLPEYYAWLGRGGGLGDLYREERARYEADPQAYWEWPDPTAQTAPMSFEQQQNILGQAMELVNPLMKFGGAIGMTAKQAARMDTARKAAQRRSEAAGRLERPVEWSPPPEGEWLLDRALIREAMEGHPGIEQTPLARLPAGPRMDLETIQIPFRSMPNKELIRAQIERGRGAGGEQWYQSTYPIRARMEEIGQPGGPTFEDFAWANAITSPQSPVAVNAPTATALMTLQRRGVPLTKENLDLLQEEMAGKYGEAAKRYFSPGERLKQYEDYLETGMPPAGYEAAEKISAYGQGLRGNLQSIPLDTHELQGLTYGTRAYPYFKSEGSVPKGHYGEFERRYRDLISPMGLMPASGQASRWIGGGELTGLRTAPGDYLSILENLARYKASIAGEPTRARALQELDKALTGQEPLLPWYRKGPMPGSL